MVNEQSGDTEETQEQPADDVAEAVEAEAGEESADGEGYAEEDSAAEQVGEDTGSASLPA